MADESDTTFSRLKLAIKDLFSFKSLNADADTLPAHLTKEQIDTEIKNKTQNETGIDRIKEILTYE